MATRKLTELEPGFIQAFRLFVVTRMVFWVVIGPILVVMQVARGGTVPPGSITDMTVIERLTLPNVAPVIVMDLVLLALLVLPQVQRRLGNWFVPATLILGLVPVLIGFYWWPTENPLQTPFAIFFFVMLVLIAWQYPFRYVVVYVLGLTLYQNLLTWPMTEMPFSVHASWLVLQAAMMLLVGYVIVQLVSIQREQRQALARAYEQQAAANVRLQRYAAALEELTISRERNRLARELHDTLAHSLSAVIVQLEAVRSLWPLDPEAARDMLDRADTTARRGLTEARRALQALRASPLQDLGLVLALREMAQTAAERAGATLELHISEQVAGDLPAVVEQGVYRIAQETLENTVRHAEARSIVFRLEQNTDSLTLTIEDDGRGIDAEEMRAWEAGGQDHLGLRGMDERASMIGGEMEIWSPGGEGTRVRLTVPLTAPEVFWPGTGDGGGQMTEDGS
ncbi:MAG TPA: sensor histidine kinase [Anaerolineae bacterium]|nr:sensor histidine kinase [Anaerolineae bacterium]